MPVSTPIFATLTTAHTTPPTKMSQDATPTIQQETTTTLTTVSPLPSPATAIFDLVSLSPPNSPIPTCPLLNRLVIGPVERANHPGAGDPGLYRQPTMGELKELWKLTKALFTYQKEHRKYPVGFYKPGTTKVLPIAHALMSLAKPPTKLTEFLSPMGVQWGEHRPLSRLLAACQQDLEPFLPEKRNPSVHRHPGTPHPSPANEFIMSTDEESAPPRGDPNHPGPDWTSYSFGQTDHYPVFIRDGEDLITMDYIHYKQDNEETYIKGTMGKGSPIYRKSLHACPQLNPNLDNPRHIRDDHLHIFQPESTVKELID
jgi:hypothetical protein